MFDLHHLNKTESSYFQHLVFAMWLNLLALAIVITGVIHAFIPWIFPFTPYHLAQKIIRDTEKYFRLGRHVKP